MATLDTLAAGTEALLIGLAGDRPFQRRLMEMGLLPGTRFRLVRKNDLGGVLELKVRQSHVTLRKGEAAFLTVASA